MRQTLRVNTNLVEKQGYGNFKENTFHQIEYRISLPLTAQIVDIRESETEVTGVDTSQNRGSISNFLCNVGMYEANGSNPAPKPYEEDIALNRASGYGDH